ncbi:unnamed protein product [Somion occarium]|uniref:Uncharacterized protein n=1 Tax=Somion occarium TaxID=3059160 RepID=A0ABP1D510_9APHY
MAGIRGNKSSQQSTSSDDNGIMAAVTQQMQATWEKKRKENEAKFLTLAKAELDRSDEKADEFIEVTEKMDSIYARFLMDYASISDDIRRIMVALLDEHSSLLELARRKRKTIDEANRQREKGQVQGLAMTKKAVEDCNRLICSLDPSA